MTNYQPDMVYQPRGDKDYRVAWYGIHTNQLSFEKSELNYVDDGASGSYITEWVTKDVRDLGNAMPTSTKEMLEEMRCFYEEGIDQEIIRYAESM